MLQKCMSDPLFPQLLKLFFCEMPVVSSFAIWHRMSLRILYGCTMSVHFNPVFIKLPTLIPNWVITLVKPFEPSLNWRTAKKVPSCIVCGSTKFCFGIIDHTTLLKLSLAFCVECHASTSRASKSKNFYMP